MNFLTISEEILKNGTINIVPNFILLRNSDVMIRGNDFYACWNAQKGTWTTDDQECIELIDAELDNYVEQNKDRFVNRPYQVLYLRETKNKQINHWREYCKKQNSDHFHDLDGKLVFANDKVSKKDYSTHRLSYNLEAKETPCYTKLANTLYSERELHKIEWFVGSIIAGDSVHLQKFLVFYGKPGSGKSTILNIVEKLFEGYCASFDSKSLGRDGGFPLESLKDNPLIAIQHDGDLSKIEDNSTLNSLISHEEMVVNVKHKNLYSMRFKTILFMATNKPIRITDAKSGLLRRLVDVSPSGEKMEYSEYTKCIQGINDELGGIAQHCLDVYSADPSFYDDYRPNTMMGSTNDFYNFVAEYYYIFEKSEVVTLKEAYVYYEKYAESSGMSKKMSKTPFKEELKSYFKEYHERYTMDDGSRIWNAYLGIKDDLFEVEKLKPLPAIKKNSKINTWLHLDCTKSLLDDIFKNCPAQYAVLTKSGDRPKLSWNNNTVILSDIDTSKLHYVKPDEHYITVDFDIVDEDGNKSLEANLSAASKWPPTYAELSKSGKGIHLEYYYPGDVTELDNIYEPHVEIKVFTGGASLRRKLTKCNDISIATIHELPLKKKVTKPMFNEKAFKNEEKIFEFIQRAIEVEIVNGKPVVKNYNHAHAPNIQLINKKLNDAYDSGMSYDVSTTKNALIRFAAESSHQSNECLKIVSSMPFKSADLENDIPNNTSNEDAIKKPIAFFDVEVFKNLFILCYKTLDSDTVTKLILPAPEMISTFINSYRIVGFNNRRFDNHIIYAAMNGYSTLALYKLSQDIITDKLKNAFFGSAWDISYTDIYDYSSKKQSLKKWEIELGIPHKECSIPWDEEVPEARFNEVADYCANDVIATEAVWKATQADFIAREILADITGLSVNSTTNTLTKQLIFGNERNPQSEFNYRDMSTGGCTLLEPIDAFGFDNFTIFDCEGRPVFPGYSYQKGVSSYRDVPNVGEGGRVFAKPGMYCNVALLDIASMHPHSIIAENLFGDRYTKIFKDLVDLRICIKHKDFENAGKLLGGVCTKYLDNPDKAKQLAQALKIAINSVYGLTSAKFRNEFRDDRNIDNIVAKRGALFMINLQHEVEKRGYTVAHIKTDSIKIPDATPEIIDFVMKYGKAYGYSFEHEATYERMCLVNDAVYIAKYANSEWCKQKYGYSPEENSTNSEQWTATGTQFQVPYVFKTLFSKEALTYADYCETKSVTSALYLDFNETLPDVSEAEEVFELRKASSDSKLTKREQYLIDKYSNMSDESLIDLISSGHNRCFIGKVGLFIPVKQGTGGGELLRENNGKFNSATGAKGYRWKEADMATNGLADIDISYYEDMCNDAIKSINDTAFSNCWFGGDYAWFVGKNEAKEPKYMYVNGLRRPDYPDELPWN